MNEKNDSKPSSVALPTYSDVAMEEDKWSPELILKMWDSGVSAADIHGDLLVGFSTIYRIINNRSDYE